MAPSNGLLLCSTHYALFDADILSITPEWTIVCLRGKVLGHRWTEADRLFAIALDGQPIAVPSDPLMPIGRRAGLPSGAHSELTITRSYLSVRRHPYAPSSPVRTIFASRPEPRSRLADAEA